MLDLDQTTLPGIAHLLVETMIISDQIRAEDRANVLRALLLKHRWVEVRHQYSKQSSYWSWPMSFVTAASIGFLLNEEAWLHNKYTSYDCAPGRWPVEFLMAFGYCSCRDIRHWLHQRVFKGIYCLLSFLCCSKSDLSSKKIHKTTPTDSF